MNKNCFLIIIISLIIMLAGCSLALIDESIGSGIAAEKSITQEDQHHTPTEENEQNMTSDDEVRGNIFISEAGIAVFESFPIQVVLYISGELPTPCHQFQAFVSPPDLDNKINVDVYTVVEPDAVCIQIMQPFEESVSIPMIGQEDGKYSVWVNGEKVGEFTYPG